ncbi:MAG: glycosyltransferase [Anaerolineae bacterium]|nr:glycosyltransferase [Anaerolineae bacterium]
MSAPRQDTRVLVLSPIGTAINPYIGLFCQGLRAAGADVRLASQLTTADLAKDSRPDVIHLHWLERYDLPRAILARSLHGAHDLPRRGLRRLVEGSANAGWVYQLRRWLRLRRLLGLLSRFQHQGGLVAFTVHNLEPHEKAGWADRWGMARMVGQADIVHVHDASTAGALQERFKRGQGVVTIPHGHYLTAYPNEIGRVAARDRLELPQDAFVFATLGLLRPYKGLEELVPAFRALTEEKAYLVLAGQPESPTYAERLTALIAGDPRIRLRPGLVPNEEVQVYLNAADAVVLPYRQITTSGAALLAFSFGRPIVAPAIGAFPNLVAGCRGILYDPHQPEGLAAALEQARRTDWSDARDEIIAWVRQFDWSKIGRALLEAYGLYTSTDSTGSTGLNPNDL